MPTSTESTASVDGAPKRQQIANVIDCLISVARVRSNCRKQLNGTVDSVKSDIADKATGPDGNKKIKWSSLPAETRSWIENVASKVKVKADETAPVPKSMSPDNLTALASTKAFKCSQFANVALTTCMDFVIHRIVELAMRSARADDKNNIMFSHIINPELVSDEVFALIYNLPALKAHQGVLDKLASDASVKEQVAADKVTARKADAEKRKVEREAEKARAKKSGKKTKSTPVKKDDDAEEEEEKVESVKKGKKVAPTKKNKKSEKKSVVAKKKSTKKAKKDSDDDSNNYCYYVEKIVQFQKVKLGDEFKNMRVSSYFRMFCSDVITQIITRMTSMFSVLANLGNMKTVTDTIVLCSLRLIFTDSRIDCPELFENIRSNVITYRAYRAEKAKNKVDEPSATNADDDGDEDDDDEEDAGAK